MEIIVQTLDDPEDLAYAFALKWERIRRACRFTVFMAAAMLLQTIAIILAFYHPPIAFATLALLLVGLLYRGATTSETEYLPFA